MQVPAWPWCPGLSRAARRAPHAFASTSWSFRRPACRRRLLAWDERPVLDGWAFIDAYRELAEDEIPIIGVSASMTTEVAARLRNLGVRVCLAKPFDLDELIVWAKRVLGSDAAVA